MRPVQPVPCGDGVTSSPLVRAMAQVIADTTIAAGCCTDDDLRRRGFSRAVIDRNEDRARAEARNILVRRGVE